MNYRDGRPVIIGDEVSIGPTLTGIVVCSIDDKLGTPEYPIEAWAYLEHGIIVETPQIGILHLPKADEDLVLVRRREGLTE